MRKWSIAAAAILALSAAAPARAEVRLAYVDVQRALNECDAGKRAKADFEGKVQVIQSRLQREQDQIQSLKDELEKKGMLMQPDQRQALQDQYMDKEKNFEREYKDTRDDLQQKDNEVTSKIVHDLAEVIRTLGERNGYTMVMEKGSILWGAPGIDITDEVIRQYNSMHVKMGSLGNSDIGAPRQRAGASQPSEFGANAARSSTISK